MYQIRPRSFADSDGDGIGHLGGIKSRLGDLAALGVDVLTTSTSITACRSATSARLTCAPSRLLVLAGCSGQPVTVDVPDADRRQGAEQVLADVPEPDALRAQLELQPWEARVRRHP